MHIGQAHYLPLIEIEINFEVGAKRVKRIGKIRTSPVQIHLRDPTILKPEVKKGLLPITDNLRL